MSRLEKYELVAIIAFISVLLVCAEQLPSQISLGIVVLRCAALLLLQGLIRDLCLLWQHKLQTNNTLNNTTSARRSQSLCLESSIGIVGIGIGALFFFTQPTMLLSMNSTVWVLLLSGVVVLGFLMKDWVLMWNPWRIRREQDHINMIFTFKK